MVSSYLQRMGFRWVPGRVQRNAKVWQPETNCRVEKLELSRKYKQTSSSTLRYTFSTFCNQFFSTECVFPTFSTQKAEVQFHLESSESFHLPHHEDPEGLHPHRPSLGFVVWNVRILLNQFVESQVQTSHEYKYSILQAGFWYFSRLVFCFFFPRGRRGWKSPVQLVNHESAVKTYMSAATVYVGAVFADFTWCNWTLCSCKFGRWWILVYTSLHGGY